MHTREVAQIVANLAAAGRRPGTATLLVPEPGATPADAIAAIAEQLAAAGFQPTVEHGAASVDEFAGAPFDVVVSVLPPKRGWDDRTEQVESRRADGWYRFGVPPKSDDAWLVLGRMVEQLRPSVDGGGRAVAVVPATAIAPSAEVVQRAVLEADLIDTIVLLPDDAFGLATEPLAIVFDNDKPADRRGQIRAVDLRSSSAAERSVPLQRLLSRRTLVRRGDPAPAEWAQRPNWMVQVPGDEDVDAYLSRRYGRDDIAVEKAGEPRADLDVTNLFSAYAEDAFHAELATEGSPVTRLTAVLAASPTIAKAPVESAADTVFLPVGSAPVSLDEPGDDASDKMVVLILDTALIDPPSLVAWLNGAQGTASRDRARAIATAKATDSTGASSTVAFRRYVDEILIPLP